MKTIYSNNDRPEIPEGLTKEQAINKALKDSGIRPEECSAEELYEIIVDRLEKSRNVID